MHKTLVSALLALTLCISCCWAQVEMRQPPPRRSKFSKYYISNDDVDYNMKSPLGGKNVYPCRGTQAGPNEGTLVAGQDVKVFFDGAISKQGGDCQFAISYDNGTTFAVIWDKLGNCFLDTVNGGYEVPVPDRIPASKSAIFAWSWIPAAVSNNAVERGYYMNCADVRIENYGKQQAYTGKELLVVNVPGKPSVPVVKYPAKDTLPDLLDSRQLVTVGEPVESTDTSTNAAEATQEDKKDEDGEVKEANDQDGRQRNESESAASNDEQEAEDGGDQGTVVMYVSESTATTTQVVYVSEYVTEEDTLRAQYTYGAGIQTKGQLSTTLGPYAKPLFGTNVGLTVIPDTTSLASTNLIPFTDESLSISNPTNKWLASGSTDYIPPSIAGPKPTPTASKSADILLALGHSSTLNSLGSFDTMFAAGSPLFTDPVTNTFETPRLNSITTNRPPFSSVTDQARTSAMSNHLHPTASPETQRPVTILSTVTKDGKPVLQVVVSLQSTAIPSSLTIAF